MIEIGVSNLTKAYGVDVIFENVTFDVKTKDRIGLLGRNGTGIKLSPPQYKIE